MTLWGDMSGYEFLYSTEDMDFTEVYELDASSEKPVYKQLDVDDIPLELQIKVKELIKVNYEL